MPLIKSIISRKPLQLGFLYISKQNASLFPSTNSSVKIKALLDDSEQEVQVTYNPKYKRIHGLTAFYREHNAQIGDFVETEILEPFKKYRFIFRKSSTPAINVKPSVKTGSVPLVGPPINFRGLTYAPTCENGVIYLFSKVAEDLGIVIEGVQVRFPDAFGKRYEKDKGYPITIEFEYRSSDYERHGHPKEGCDYVVCWEHDWKECPIQVIELKSLLRELKEKRQTESF